MFMDCDMLVRCDLHDIWAAIRADEDAARAWEARSVWVCPHDYTPRAGLKATGAQTTYPRKNWSSFMVFNNAECQALSPEYVNTASPADLHRLVWAGDRVGHCRSISTGWSANTTRTQPPGSCTTRSGPRASRPIDSQTTRISGSTNWRT
jgi:hypothetical protein